MSKFIQPRGYVDEHGKPIRRTPHSHRYSYDGFVVCYRDGKATGTAYSDRILHWDYEKHNRLCKKHFGDDGQYWRDRQPEKVEAFCAISSTRQNCGLCA